MEQSRCMTLKGCWLAKKLYVNTGKRRCKDLESVLMGGGQRPRVGPWGDLEAQRPSACK